MQLIDLSFIGNSSENFSLELFFSTEIISPSSLLRYLMNLMNSELCGTHNLINCSFAETTFKYAFLGLCLVTEIYIPVLLWFEKHPSTGTQAFSKITDFVHCIHQ